MTESADAGDWVEIQRTVLEAGQRAPQVPADTQTVALEMRVRGHALESCSIGSEIPVRTAAGRTLRGMLVAVNPVHPHGFGSPPPELTTVAAELRAILESTEHSA